MASPARRYPKSLPVNVTIKFQCGCGYETDIEMSAKQHAVNSHHEMIISGKVVPTEPKKKKVKETISGISEKEY